MVEYFKTVDGRITQVEKPEAGCWINLVAPTGDEVRQILCEIDVDDGFLRAALDPEESSRVETEEGQLLLIVDIPVLDDSSTRDVQMYTTLPMAIIVVEDYVITVCLEDTSVTRQLANGKVRGVQIGLKTRFVFQLLLRVAGRFLNYLRRIQRSFTKIEQRLYESLDNEELMQLIALSKSLIYFSASLRGNEVTMEKVLRGRLLKLYEDDRDLLEDALIEVRQAIDMASVYSSVMSSTMEAYSSVVSNNLNSIMKVLTIITVILTIPNMIFGFYGMNVVSLPLPFAWFPTLIAVFSCVVAWVFLKIRKLY